MDKYRTSYTLTDLIRQHIDMARAAEGDFSCTLTVHIRKHAAYPDVLTVSTETTSMGSVDYSTTEGES